MRLGISGMVGAAALLLGSDPPAAPLKLAGEAGELGKLSWMVGSWVSDAGPRQSDEHWTHAAGGTMFGVNRTVANDRTVFFEYLRIEKTEAGIVYLASPKGRQPPTAFTLIESGEKRAVFENPQHDFPQRIVYWREGEALRARIEGTVNGEAKSSEWGWRRGTLVVE